MSGRVLLRSVVILWLVHVAHTWGEFETPDGKQYDQPCRLDCWTGVMMAGAVQVARCDLAKKAKDASALIG